MEIEKNIESHEVCSRKIFGRGGGLTFLYGFPMTG